MGIFTKEKGQEPAPEKELVYSLTDDQEQFLLECIHRFDTYGSHINYYVREQLDSADYLRGIADTMPNGERMHHIADLITEIKILFSSVTVMEAD